MSILIYKDEQQTKDTDITTELINEAKGKIKDIEKKVVYSSTQVISKISPCVIIERKDNKTIIAPKIKMTPAGIKEMDLEKIMKEEKTKYETIEFEYNQDEIEEEKNDDEEEEEQVIDPKGDTRNTQADRINLYKGYRYTKDPLDLYIKDSTEMEDEKEEDEEPTQMKLILLPLEQRLIDMFDLNIK